MASNNLAFGKYLITENSSLSLDSEMPLFLHGQPNRDLDLANAERLQAQAPALNALGRLPRRISRI